MHTVHCTGEYVGFERSKAKAESESTKEKKSNIGIYKNAYKDFDHQTRFKTTIQ